MDEDMNLLEERMKYSRVFKAEADTVNKELIITTGDQHRRSNLRHHVRLRAEPPLKPPQTTNTKAMISSRSPPPPPPPIRARVLSSICPEFNGRSSGRGKQRGRERERGGGGCVGGGGMQAFFLDSGKRSSCGTGVFLPQTNLSTNKKPACAPVLLPSRVVQALKINVQSIGVQISTRQDAKDRSTVFSDCKLGKSRHHGGKHEPTECGRVVSPTRSSSSSPADIFLPKEWTY